jgi:hypothetical protein
MTKKDIQAVRTLLSLQSSTDTTATAVRFHHPQQIELQKGPPKCKYSNGILGSTGMYGIRGQYNGTQRVYTVYLVNFKLTGIDKSIC